jgi:hypothetical protein
MTSFNDSVSTCVRRINDQLRAYNTAKLENQLLRSEIANSSGPAKTDLEAQLQLKAQEKTEQARIGLNAQIELLQLLRGSTLDVISLNVQEAMAISFPGERFSELRNQFELDRDIAISPSGQLTAIALDGITSVFILMYSIYTNYL